MNSPIDAFRTQLTEAITRLRERAGTVVDREYERVLALVHGLPAPSEPLAAKREHLASYARSGVSVQAEPICTPAEIANGTCTR